MEEQKNMKSQSFLQTLENNPNGATALKIMDRPIWPLCRLTILLYLTSAHDKLQDVFSCLPDPVEIENVEYEKPTELLEPYIPFLTLIEQLKPSNSSTDNSYNVPDQIVNETGNNIDIFEKTIYWIQHKVIEKELEVINSYLCGSVNCIICCTGPNEDARHEFFEIPLSGDEINLFNIPKHDNEYTVQSTPYTEPPLTMDGVVFYKNKPAIYHWQYGWSLILPRATECPHLDKDGRCKIYDNRPDVCKRPQIFPKVMEKDIKKPDAPWRYTRTLLAILDCPYVVGLKEKISQYAQKNELDCVFTHNKI